MGRCRRPRTPSSRAASRWPFGRGSPGFRAEESRWRARPAAYRPRYPLHLGGKMETRSEEHTSDQSLRHLVCRLLLEKKIGAGAVRGFGVGLLVGVAPSRFTVVLG